MPDAKQQILFDGICNMCNGWVDFVTKRDPKKRFEFIAMQSKAGKQRLQELGLPVDTMKGLYLVRNGRAYHKSGGVLRIFSGLSGLWPLLFAFWIVPFFIRDFVYDFIAKRRYQWFGKREFKE